MPRVCFDRILPQDLLDAPLGEPKPGHASRGAFERVKLWDVGQVLRVAFMEGTEAEHALVRRVAPEWSKHGNIKFDFVNNAKPQIRITFKDNDGSWSYLGTDAEGIHKSKPTMNFEWLDEAVILHEFGHAIGMIHEHENPLGGIKWDRKTVDNNMFSVYARSQVNATKVDKDSIMLYEVPKAWTLDGFSSKPNEKLSAGDKAFVGHKRNYPMSGARVK